MRAKLRAELDRMTPEEGDRICEDALRLMRQLVEDARDPRAHEPIGQPYVDPAARPYVYGALS